MHEDGGQAFKGEPKTARLRGRAGVKQRDRRLQRTNYLCEMCLPDKVTIATVVDHIIPLSHGGEDIDSNTRNLCRDHDLKATAKQFGYKAHKQQIGADGWPQ
jgi:5-methylcytosine-specific restriction protein A